MGAIETLLYCYSENIFCNRNGEDFVFLCYPQLYLKGKVRKKVLTVGRNNEHLKSNQRKPACKETTFKGDFGSGVERKAAEDRKWLSANEESLHLYCPYTTRQEITQEAADEEEVWF